MVIFCGPIKKLINLKLNNSYTYYGVKTSDKKLKTWLREKKASNTVNNYRVERAPDRDVFSIAYAPPILQPLIFKAIPFTAQNLCSVDGGFGVSLFLYFRKLLI